MKTTGNTPNQASNPENKTYKIPVEGSLGLLALGFRGIKAWREKRMEEFAKKQALKQSEAIK